MPERNKLTWNDLAIYAGSLPADFRDKEVFACVYGEFIPVEPMESLDDEILSDGHPYLEVAE
jgi:hypothetical protein